MTASLHDDSGNILPSPFLTFIFLPLFCPLLSPFFFYYFPHNLFSRLSPSSSQTKESTTVTRSLAGGRPKNIIETVMPHPRHAYFLLLCEEGLPFTMLLTAERLTIFLDSASSQVSTLVVMVWNTTKKP